MSYRRYLEMRIDRPIGNTLDAILEDLRTLPERLEEQLGLIELDESLSPEERAFHEREKRSEAQRHLNRLLPIARELAADAQSRLTEERARRSVDPVARDRVRSLLGEQGSAPSAVLEHARAQGDPGLVAALGAELADRALTRLPGQPRPDPQQARSAEEMRIACDRALVEMEGDSRLEKALAFYDAAQTVEPTVRFAVAGTERSSLGATARARLVMAHATGEDGDPYQEEPRYQERAQPVSGVGAVAPRPQLASGSGIRTSRDR
jgi:hypothetical protein